MNRMGILALAPLALGLIIFVVMWARFVLRKFSERGVPLKPGQIVTVGGIDFRVTPFDQTDFNSLDAIYVILAAAPDGRFQVLHAGGSPDHNTPPSNLPELKASWTRQSSDVWVGVYLLPSDRNMKEDRVKILQTLQSLI